MLSIHTVKKSENIISTIGRMPQVAAPAAMPVKLASQIGVSRIRSPNFSVKPREAPNAPPEGPTSFSNQNNIGISGHLFMHCLIDCMNISNFSHISLKPLSLGNLNIQALNKVIWCLRGLDYFEQSLLPLEFPTRSDHRSLSDVWHQVFSSSLIV